MNQVKGLGSFTRFAANCVVDLSDFELIVVSQIRRGLARAISLGNNAGFDSCASDHGLTEPPTGINDDAFGLCCGSVRMYPWIETLSDVFAPIDAIQVRIENLTQGGLALSRHYEQLPGLLHEQIHAIGFELRMNQRAFNAQFSRHILERSTHPLHRHTMHATHRCQNERFNEI